MEPPPAKPSSIRSLLIRALLFGVAVLLLRFLYVVSVHGASCDLSGDFCLFSSPAAVTVPTAVASLRLGSASSPSLWSSREYRRAVDYYSAVFQDLVVEGFLSPTSKSLVLDSPAGHEVLALKEIGVADSIAISKKKSPPLVVSGDLFHQPFGNNSFDFIFAGRCLDRPVRPADLAGEISRILKPEGFLVVLTSSAGDLYSLRSLQDLFPSFQTVRSREIDGPDSSLTLREVVLRKEIFEEVNNSLSGGNTVNNNCSVAEHKLEIIRSAEPLIEEEPLKPWITLKKNAQKIKYLPSVADISFKQRYVYIDVGARSYGSSIVSWFKKQYPKQNRTFEVYAIEADKAFYPEYKLKKGINLIPFAAWVRNESLSFEVNHEPDPKSEGRGMGRIKPSNGGKSSADVHAILGFDFAEWLRSTVTERDFVVMKMDVEGTEFDLIPRLFETGAICLIDELFLECHYNRWQRCCPGVRSPKYQYTYGQCLDLFSSLRSSGVLVHQWW